MNFTELLAAIDAVLNTATAIDYDPSWANGTGYFNGATNIVVKTSVTCRDEAGRKILIVPVDGAENLVLFQRYAGEENQDFWVGHIPTPEHPQAHHTTGAAFDHVEKVWMYLTPFMPSALTLTT